MGRKPTGRERNKTLGPKFTDAEIEEIREKARESGLRQADFILSKIRGEKDEN